MYPQGSSPSLQGGSGLALQGSTYNPQPAAKLNLIQPAAGGSTLGSGRLTIGASQTALTQPVAQPSNDISGLLASIASLNSQLAAQRNAIAPNLNLGSIYNQARGTAEANVNPYYTKQLQDFQAQQAAEKVNQQKQTQMNIESLQEQLQNTLAGNAITQGRTAQDVATNEQQIAQKADQQQTDQGTQFDQARLAQAKQLASQGLATSGLGSQQVQSSQEARNLQETRQAQDVAQQNQAQELFKTRTFEDLARSGTLATKAEAKGETQANFDLNKYIQGQDFALSQQKDTLEQQRLSRVSQETASQAKLLVNQFIQSIANPAQRQAAVQAYGGAF